MQIGGMQSLRRAMRRRHQHTYFREGDPGIMAKLAALMDQGAFYVAQVGASMTSLVLCNDFINGLDDGLGVPIGGAPVPVIKPDFAAKMQPSGFKGRRGIELEAYFKIGRASGRERVCRYGEYSVVGVSLKKKRQ